LPHPPNSSGSSKTPAAPQRSVFTRTI
jgi:hypothetical protein